MTDETLTPQVGDVWIGADRTTRLVCTTGPMMFALSPDFRHVGETSRDFVEWFAGARLVLRDGKSYQSPTPAQVGDVITVPCAVLLRPDGTVMVDGSDDATGDETAGSWTARYKHIATVSVIVPQSLKEVPSLPPVTATPA